LARERFALDSSATLAVMLRPRKDVLELAARGQYDGYGQLLNTQRLARESEGRTTRIVHGGRVRTGWPGHPDYTGASMPTPVPRVDDAE